MTAVMTAPTAAREMKEETGEWVVCWPHLRPCSESARLTVSKDCSCWYNILLEYMEAGPLTSRPPPGHTDALWATAVRQVEGFPARALPADRPRSTEWLAERPRAQVRGVVPHRR
jgi:hypothetical protein